MTVDEIAFRAVMYRELHRQRYTHPGDLAGHVEEMGASPAALVLTFYERLAAEDWQIAAVLDLLDGDAGQGAIAALGALLVVYDPDRLEAVVHALDMQPPMDDGWHATVLGRWGEVRAAIDDLSFWQARADDLPFRGFDVPPDAGEVALRDGAQAVLAHVSVPGEDPAVAASRFTQIFNRVAARFLGASTSTPEDS
jgi:hypothetical protein